MCSPHNVIMSSYYLFIMDKRNNTVQHNANATIQKDSAVVEILQDEKGISPGQACVFYSKDNLGERVLGGGWIDRTINKNLSTQLTNH